MRFSYLSALVFSLFLLAGCDDGGSGGSGGSGASGGSGGSGGSGASGTTTTNNGGSGGGVDFSACDGKFEGQEAGCQTCVQENCAESLVACCETEGCAEVVTCAREAGCGGIECYTDGGMPGPCAETIDMYGGPLGEGVSAAQDFGTCAQAKCTEACSM